MIVHAPEPPEKAPEASMSTFFGDPPPPELPRPFMRLGNICIQVDRIVSVELLPNAKLYKVGESIIYREATAEQEADLFDRSVEEFNTPVMYLRFINASGMTENIRRWGDEAEEIWNYVIKYLASP